MESEFYGLQLAKLTASNAVLRRKLTEAESRISAQQDAIYRNSVEYTMRQAAWLEERTQLLAFADEVISGLDQSLPRTVELRDRLERLRSGAVGSALPGDLQGKKAA